MAESQWAQDSGFQVYFNAKYPGGTGTWVLEFLTDKRRCDKTHVTFKGILKVN